ncbi:hypothetical protein Pcinc_039936 [Petrolisthes cinctipes]|uniref:Uncharacterized protein n=1 Tax=Petrolisthes cinctipes TaxID=88211 RepID=A0AAE1BN63_PETCI|nr:hypothetical protein Pcinc_039936 [Petrolisthes cinctipes]
MVIYFLRAVQNTLQGPTIGSAAPAPHIGGRERGKAPPDAPQGVTMTQQVQALWSLGPWLYVPLAARTGHGAVSHAHETKQVQYHSYCKRLSRPSPPWSGNCHWD